MKVALSVERAIQIEREHAAEAGFSKVLTNAWINVLEPCLKEFWEKHDVQEMLMFSVDESWTYSALVRLGNQQVYTPIEVDEDEQGNCLIKLLV